VNPLTREFLSWVATRPLTYRETMDAWRTSCPRHSVWEDATIEGLVEVADGDGDQAIVTLTALGMESMRGR